MTSRSADKQAALGAERHALGEHLQALYARFKSMSPSDKKECTLMIEELQSIDVRMDNLNRRLRRSNTEMRDAVAKMTSKRDKISQFISGGLN